VIVCHCNKIACTDIERACCQLEADGKWRMLTPGAVYHCLGKRVRCGGCMPLATSLIHGRRAGVSTPPEAGPLGAVDCPLADTVPVVDVTIADAPLLPAIA
jgi:hypothetical protein